MKYVKFLLSLFWLLPFNILFGFLPLLVLSPWLRIDRMLANGSLLVMPRPYTWLSKKWGASDWAGFAWCPTVMFVFSDLVPGTIRHEQRHQYQQMLFGTLFYVFYGLDYIVSFVSNIRMLWDAKAGADWKKRLGALHMKVYDNLIFESDAYRVGGLK